jgi:hypothetical protein
MPWLPPDFQHPRALKLPCGYHLRPIREADVDLDYPAVMGSRERLWETYGEAWGWPPATMTVDQDRADLAYHEREMGHGLSFNYAMFDAGERDLFGCLYIDPPAAGRDGDDVDAVVSWWVVDQAVGSPLEVDLGEVVPRWLGHAWPFSHVRYGVFPP